MIKCARDGCEVEFKPRKHNMKYCGKQCCDLATNVRLIEKYWQRKAQKSGQVRFCTVCEQTKLSRYNDTTVCSSCQMKKEVEMNNSVSSMLASVNWNLELA